MIPTRRTKRIRGESAALMSSVRGRACDRGVSLDEWENKRSVFEMNGDLWASPPQGFKPDNR